LCRDFASAEAMRGLSDRPLDPFGTATFGAICGFAVLVAWGIASAEATKGQ